MINEVPYWRPPPTGRLSDVPADIYEKVRNEEGFWGNGYYNPDYEYGTIEQNFEREIPFPWPMTADDVALCLQIANEIIVFERRFYTPDKRPDIIPNAPEEKLFPQGGWRKEMEKEFRLRRKDFLLRMVYIHGYDEYHWPGELDVRFFDDPHRRNKLTMEFSHA